MEEHSFYLFLIKVMATRSIRAGSSLSLQDREKSLAMASVCTDDLRVELQFYKSFKHDDSQLPYVASVLEHVRSIVSLHMPLDKDLTFPLAPSWNTPLVDENWQRSYYRSLTNKKWMVFTFISLLFLAIRTMVPCFAIAIFSFWRCFACVHVPDVVGLARLCLSFLFFRCTFLFVYLVACLNLTFASARCIVSLQLSCPSPVLFALPPSFGGLDCVFASQCWFYPRRV